MSTAMDPMYQNIGIDADEPAGEDDWTIMPSAAPSKTAEEIASENGYRDIPPGDHTLILHSYNKPEMKHYKCMVNGQMAGFQAMQVAIRFCLPNDQGAQVTDWFVCPPSNPADLLAYTTGLALDAKSGARGGFQANKFYHLMGALGFDWKPGEMMPAVANNPKNWKGRALVATILPASGTWTKKDKNTGEETEQPNSPKVKLFSYRRAAQTTGNATATQGHAPAQAQAPAGNAPKATAPATPPRKVGVNAL